MNKPAALRALLTQVLPYLASEPDRLVMFIEGGKVAAGLGGPSFEYKYTLTIGLLDFALHPDQVMIPLRNWLQANEPSLLQNPDHAREAITFDAEFLNHNSYDLKLTVKLSERVRVTREGDSLRADHLGEPALPEGPLVTRVRIYQDGELIDDSGER